MKPIRDAWAIQIEVTNACQNSCAHCTRAVRHVRKPYFMEPSLIELALRSLDGYVGRIGCMGGEPTSHPDFELICRLYQKYYDRGHTGLWTSGGSYYDRHKKLIMKTFQMQLYNDHSAVGEHHPFLIASEECVPDEDLRLRLIDQCWVQSKWSPAINPKGAFFCEIAAVLDLLFDGPGGMDIKPGWWKRELVDFQDQIDWACPKCSMAVPFPKVKNDIPVEFVSPGNLERLKRAGSPWKKYSVVDEQYDEQDIKAVLEEGYRPWDYLGPNRTRVKGMEGCGKYNYDLPHEVCI